MVTEFNQKQQQPFDRSLKIRITCLMLACMGVSATMIIRAAHVQILKNPRLENMARRQFQSHALIRPRRGAILDRRGEPLAINVAVNSLAANPNKISNKRAIAKLLSRSVDVPYTKLFRRLSEKREFVWIKRHLSENEIKRFKKLRIMDSAGDLVEGLWLVKESDRVYPHGKLAAHILGDVNVDAEGLEGVELWMNERLRGKVVSVSAIKDALGRPTFIDAVAARGVHDGESVSLTLDASLQYEVEQELANAVHRTSSKAGTVVVMNAMNGEILAMANEPSFNPNEKGVPADRRRNRAITDGYEPGSTLKAMLLASVLAHGGKLTDQVWGERGAFVVQGHKISEAEAREKFEWVTLKKMIQVSSNIAAAKFAMKLGADRYHKMIHSFGFGSKTEVGFPGEISGRVPARKDWSPLSLSNIGFGQGILVTPIQMVRAYAALLNGGWLVKPSLLKKNEVGSPIELPTRIFSKKVSHDALEALASVTEEGGTGGKASLSGYRVAGKTGTAQMVDPKTGRYSKDKYISSFIGFPLDVEPPIVIFTALMEPKNGYYAATTAAPLFKEVLSSVANRCSLPMSTQPKQLLAERMARDKQKVLQSPLTPPLVSINDIKFKRPETVGTGILNSNVSERDPGWVMPALKGLTPREVVQVLRGHRFNLEVNGIGIVSSHFPDAGKTIAEGTTLRLVLSEP